MTFRFAIHHDPATAGTLQRRQRALTLVSLGIVLAAGETVILLTNEHNDTTWWAVSPFVLIPIAAAIKCFHTAKRLTGIEKKAWRSFGLACSAYFITEATWFTHKGMLQIWPPFFSISILFYCLFGFFILAGIWHYQNRDSTVGRNLVQAGNLGIILSSIVLAYLFLFFELVRTYTTTSDLLINLTAAVIAMSLPSFGLIAAVFHLSGGQRKVMFVFLFGLIAYGGTFFHYTRNLLDGYQFIAGDPFNGLYLLTFACFYWAAFEQDQLKSAESFERTLRGFPRRAEQWQTLIPPFAVAGVLSIALIFRERLSASLLPYVGMACFLFIASLAVRNWWGRRLETQLRAQAKSSEDDLRIANRELLKEMKTRTHAQEELHESQKMEALGQITSEVAHDFNNLLTVILEGLKRIEEKEALADPRSQGLLSASTNTALQGTALARRLLALAHRHSLQSQRFEVGALLEDMRDSLQRTLGKNVRIYLKKNDDSILCVSDRARLEIAILSLAINSRDAMPGGGDLTIEVHRVRRDESRPSETPADRFEGYAEILIRDTGVGIPADVLPKVTDPFFTLKEPGTGSGLGLSTVCEFAKLSGGDVVIRSELGKGTEVRIYLPATHSAQSAAIEDFDRVSHHLETSTPVTAH